MWDRACGGVFLVCNDWSCTVNVLDWLLHKSLCIGTWRYSTVVTRVG